MEVTLYTRRDCPLCDEAKEAIRAAGLSAEEVDIDGDPELRERFTNDVPVIYIDGVEAFRHRVSAEQFAPLLLAREKCLPCRGGVPPLKGKELEVMRRELGGQWQVIDEHHLEKEFKLRNFAEALAFTNKIGAIAEEQGHHPDIFLAWGKVRVTIWTHKIDGLTRSDFVLAAKIDRAAAAVAG
jgi:4a-hydroxytetrahydrobiopterin dehydratase